MRMKNVLRTMLDVKTCYSTPNFFHCTWCSGNVSGQIKLIVKKYGKQYADFIMYVRTKNVVYLNAFGSGRCSKTPSSRLVTYSPYGDAKKQTKEKHLWLEIYCVRLLRAVMCIAREKQLQRRQVLRKKQKKIEFIYWLRLFRAENIDRFHCLSVYWQSNGSK